MHKSSGARCVSRKKISSRRVTRTSEQRAKCVVDYVYFQRRTRNSDGNAGGRDESGEGGGMVCLNAYATKAVISMKL